MPIKPAIYLDSCCFVDVVKEQVGLVPKGREDDVWYTKKLLESHLSGDLTILTSLLTIGECVSVEKGQAIVPEEVKDRFRNLLTSGQYVQLLTPTPKTPILIQDFRWKHSLVLGSADAIHVASAIEYGCVEFISTDGRLQSRKFQSAIPKLSEMGLRAIKAHETSFLPERYKQGDMISG